MFGAEAALADPVRVGLIGAGRIGTSHATLLARRVPGAKLVAVADPRRGAAEALAAGLGCRPSPTLPACSRTPTSRRW
jgi:myo-inositol 2-dehydrogenase / D-chiro-inositol 1-dehydrogenase